jgi:hypothetical protein
VNMNSVYVDIAIFSMDFKRSVKLLDRMIQGIQPKDIRYVYNYPAKKEVLFEDGRRAVALVADRLSKGRRYSKVYIDEDINDPDIINCVILPGLWPYPDGSDPDVEYFSLVSEE